MKPAGTTFTAEDVDLRQRRFWLSVLSTLLILAGSALNMLLHRHADPLVGMIGSLLTLVGAGLAVTWRLWVSKQRGRLELSDSTLLFAGRPLLARAKIKQAYGFGEAGKSAVRVVAARGCDLAFAHPDDAAGFLHALAQSAGETTATFHAFAGGQRTRRALMVGVPLFIVAIVGVMISLLVQHVIARAAIQLFTAGSVLIMLAPIFAFRLIVQRKLVVGTDGILVSRPLGRSEFIPFGRLREATVKGSDVILSLAGERTRRRFALGGARRMEGADVDVSARALAQRIEEARGRGRTGELGAATSALLARGTRSIGEWMGALAQITDTAGSFRSSAVPRDQLWRVVDDATATTELRAAAAIALRAELGDDERTRFRVASNVSADPALRKVFLAVGQDDEAELTAAVGDLEAKRTPAR
jgi:hypothetical protein